MRWCGSMLPHHRILHSWSINKYSRAVKSQNSHKVLSSALWDTVLSVSVWEGQTFPSCFLFRTNLPLLIKLTTVLVHRSFRYDPKSSHVVLFLFCYMNIFYGESTSRQKWTDADCSLLNFFTFSSLVPFLDEPKRTWYEALFRSVALKPSSLIKLLGYTLFHSTLLKLSNWLKKHRVSNLANYLKHTLILWHMKHRRVL